MPGGGGGGTTTTTSNTSSEPWHGIRQYLTGGENGPGIYPESGRLYNDFLKSDSRAQYGDYSKQYSDTLKGIYESPAGWDMLSSAGKVANGGYDPKFKPVNERTVDPTAAREGQGALDPTKTLTGFLDGTAQNKYVDDSVTAVTNQAGRNLTENVLPTIRSANIANGQYGGSRGDLTRSKAISRMNMDLAPTIAGMRSQADESALNRSFLTGNSLNSQAVDVASANANRGTATAFQNNDQEMKAKAQGVSNLAAGQGLVGGARGLMDTSFNNFANSLMSGQNMDWSQLAKYASIIQPAAGAWNSTSGTQQTPYYSNPAGQALGGIMSLGSLAGGLGWKPFS